MARNRKEALFIVAIAVELALMASPSKATQGASTGQIRGQSCDEHGPAIELKVGSTLKDAVTRSPSLGNTEAPGFDSGLSAYVRKSRLFRNTGRVPFEVRCPHLVAVMPKNNHVYAVEVDLIADDPYDLGKAMQLMGVWYDTFQAMHLEGPHSPQDRKVISFDRTKAYFESKSVANLPSPGQSTGAWQKGDELVGLGIQRFDVSTKVGTHNYMYVVELSVSIASAE